MTSTLAFPTDRLAKLLLPGPAGQLEVITTSPEIVRTPPTIAVICHPHPLFSGTMHNKVIYTLARCFNSMGLATVRFNFRGVGLSQGEYANGIGESDDLLAILRWLKESCSDVYSQQLGFCQGAAKTKQPECIKIHEDCSFPGNTDKNSSAKSTAIWLAGFSFGAYVAARVAKIWPVKQLICVAPPIENFPFKELPPFPCPWILVQGDADEVVSPAAVFSWLNSLEHPPEVIKIHGASHFFHGKLIELRDCLITTLNKTH
jgi:uncharacterized protein